MKTERTVLYNIIGTIMAVIVCAIVYNVVGILFGIILNYKLAVTLLSYPSTPMLYASAGMSAAGVFAGAAIANKICKPNGSGLKVGMRVYAVLVMCYFSVCTIFSLFIYGYNDAIWGYIGAVIVSMEVWSCAKNGSKYRKNNTKSEMMQ